MDLSHTSIAIRKRSLLGVLDLSLLVYRDHAWNILALLALNAFPWLILDVLILLFSDLSIADYAHWHGKLLLLTVVQAQYGTMMITIYLGMAMFEGKPTLRQAVTSFFKSSWYGLWLHGVWRMVFPVTFLIFVGDYLSTGWAVFLAMLAMVLRMARPFVSEIMLLEKTPVRKNKRGDMFFSKRSQILHRGDVIGTFVMASLTAMALTTMIAGLLFHIDKTIGLLGATRLPIQYFYWPISVWLVASYVTVFRFMTYINTRIVQEGWEVNLKVRAEGQKVEASLP